jgi:xanthine dehydrogenase large subunit
MKNIDSSGHLKGKSVFLDDMEVDQNCLHAVVFASPVAHGKILRIDFSEALKLPGIIKILTYNDIPGENELGAIIADEPLLAEEQIHYAGQPVALVVGTSRRIAKQALKQIRMDYQTLTPITDPRVAFQQKSLLMPPRTFQIGNVDDAWKNCTHIIEGRVDSGGQEHLYLETQGAYASVGENGKLTINSSTQGPTAVQKTVARILNIPMHLIEVNVQRLGGAFGGKEDQATAWAVLAALAATVTNRSVKLILDRDEDLRMTGKRHPYSSDFKIGFDENYKIKAFEAEYYQNGGAAADLSPAIIERTLFHASGSYYIPNAKLNAYSCRTNLPPNTAFRGFGAPQAFLVIESALVKAAEKLDADVLFLQKTNLIAEDQAFPFGQITENARAGESWEAADKAFGFDKLRKEIDLFNAQNKWIKKGMAVMPVCFGISFTNTRMNQARALIHIYSDGSIGLSTAAVEMGQGVNTKMVQVASRILSINPKRIKIESTNTSRVANTSPTAASAAADLNGHAVRIACEGIREKLLVMLSRVLDVNSDQLEIIFEQLFIGGKKSELNWEKIIQLAIENRVQLTEVGHYATPNIFFNKNSEKGHPFAYHVYGTAICVMKLDCLRGRYQTESIQLIHDSGKSMNVDIDLGQIEGALVQGIGWVTMEDLRFDKMGLLMSKALSTYKIPDIRSIPEKIEIKFMSTGKKTSAIFQSKAIGEPPLMYGIAAYFALHDAIKAFNPNHKVNVNSPMTPEQLLCNLYPGDTLGSPNRY